MRFADAVRYVLWSLVAVVAAANHRHYRMRSTWLPHLLANTFVLLLPDALRLLGGRGAALRPQPNAVAPTALIRAFCTVCAARRRYAFYVAPFALGYVLSHPEHNIYKGRLAERRLGGLGLDAVPHAATAFGFTALAADGLAEWARQTPPTSVLAGAVRWTSEHAPAVTAALLALVTLGWEIGEYRVHRQELRLQHGRLDQINMMWSPADTAADVAANALGWLAAVALRRWRCASDRSRFVS